MKKAIIGYGGLCKEVAQQLNTRDLNFFVDDQYVCEKTLPLSELDKDKFEVMVAISDPFVRKKIIQKLPLGTKFFSFVHPTALIIGNVQIGQGSFVGPYSILTSDTTIGDHAILVRTISIGHDCNIGNFFSAMPGAVVSGDVQIGECVYLGSNSCVKEKIKISNDVIIGLNGGVIKNITDAGVYVGSPAIFKKNLFN